MLMLFPATPVVPPSADGLHEFEDVLEETCAPTDWCNACRKRIASSPGLITPTHSKRSVAG
jgi:hypothetical protein